MNGTELNTRLGEVDGNDLILRKTDGSVVTIDVSSLRTYIRE